MDVWEKNIHKSMIDDPLLDNVADVTMTTSNIFADFSQSIALTTRHTCIKKTSMNIDAGNVGL